MFVRDFLIYIERDSKERGIDFDDCFSIFSTIVYRSNIRIDDLPSQRDRSKKSIIRITLSRNRNIKNSPRNKFSSLFSPLS